MNINTEYTKKFKEYKKKTSLSYIFYEQFTLVNYKYKIIFILSIFSFITIICSFFIKFNFVKEGEIYLIKLIELAKTYFMKIELLKSWEPYLTEAIKQGTILILYIIPITLLILFVKESRRRYRAEYKLNDGEILDLYFHPFYKKFLKLDKLDTKDYKAEAYIKSLLEYSDVISEKKTNSFLYNPFVAFSISAIIAIFVNIITNELDTFLLIQILVFAIVALMYYYMIFNTLNANNHTSFKEFLIKLKPYIKKK